MTARRGELLTFRVRIGEETAIGGDRHAVRKAPVTVRIAVDNRVDQGQRLLQRVMNGREPDALIAGNGGIFNPIGTGIIKVDARIEVSGDQAVAQPEAPENAARLVVGDNAIDDFVDRRHRCRSLTLAADQASVDLVFALNEDDHKDLVERMVSRHGLRQLTYMKELGMGNDRYQLIDIDNDDKVISPSEAVEGVMPVRIKF